MTESVPEPSVRTTSKFAEPDALEVGRAPLDHELAVRRSPEDCGEDAAPGLVGAQVAQVRDEGSIEAADRQRHAGAGRRASVGREELDVAVRAHVGARVRRRVHRHLEGQRQLCDAVVAVVADVGRPGSDRLAGLRVRDVVVAGQGEARQRERQRTRSARPPPSGRGDAASGSPLLPLPGSPTSPSKVAFAGFYHLSRRK